MAGIDWNNPDLDLDEILGFPDIDNERDSSGLKKFNFEKSRKLKSVNEIMTFENLGLDDFILYIKDNHNLNVEFFDEKQNVKLFDDENYLVGEVGIEQLPDFNLNNHLRVKVDVAFRGRGIGNLLLELYKKSIIDKLYILPDFDYVRKKSIMSFLGKLGYKIESQILSNDSERYLSDDEISVLNIKSDIDDTGLWYKMVLDNDDF